VASFGERIPENCGNHPAGFARITSNVLSWIKNIMGLSLVLSSIGPSVRAQGHLMGEYQYDVRSKSFKQGLQVRMMNPHIFISLTKIHG